MLRTSHTVRLPSFGKVPDTRSPPQNSGDNNTDDYSNHQRSYYHVTISYLSRIIACAFPLSPLSSVVFSKMASSVDAKLLKRTKFPPEFNRKVDMSKVNIEVMKK